MTRDQLEAVIETLVELAAGLKDGSGDEERGRADYGLCLTLYANGSGRLGLRGRRVEFSNVEDFHTFGSFEGLCRALEDGEGVEFDTDTEQRP